ncbi:intradiol ring-cleavage dioxygenase [Burkholderia lata]|uniref:Intradiol ring-cleavage dioxygenase n=1 Tax=Burkholderia lata (strain ATCC 17760 / DSM 23089 / LMG 22485 / NCIMB 9086 / R18194 / 383) TaxID=482957 RepID=A0A6P2ZTG1_BURL3|nr:intradiol ring-cleavage dioxygenase [Burkholderia lata]
MSHDPHDRNARLTGQVVANFDRTPSPRLGALMQRLVRHLHAFVCDRS